MVSHLFFYQLVLLELLWLCCMLHYAWPSGHAADLQRLPQPLPPPRKPPRVPKPFPGLTHQPHCDACEHATASCPQAPCAPPPPIVSTRGRRRQVHTSHHFCPDPDCRYGGWLGLGNIRANGHPVVPSDHGWVNVETRSPLASCARRSRDTAPRAVERIRHSNWSRRWAGTWVLACRENPCTLAQWGPVSVGRSPSWPNPEPMRRTLWPARSPKAMRCCTEAAMVRASSGSSSPRGSYPVAMGASPRASRYPSWRSLRRTRRLIFWTTSATSTSLGGSTVRKRGLRRASVRSR